ELVRFQQVKPGAASASERWGEARYAAFVVTGDGEVRVVDLGDAATIEAEVASFRAALHDRKRDPIPTGSALYERLIAPIQPLIAGRRKWYVAPGGALALVPFEALVTGDGRFLIEQVATTYLTSGRDLIAPRWPTSDGASLIVAAPDYD